MGLEHGGTTEPRPGATQGLAVGAVALLPPSGPSLDHQDQSAGQGTGAHAAERGITAHGEVLYLWPGGRSKTWQVYNQVRNTIKWENKLHGIQDEPKNYQQQQEGAHEQHVSPGGPQDRAGSSSAIPAAPPWLLQPSIRKALDFSSSPSFILSLSIWKAVTLL